MTWRGEFTNDEVHRLHAEGFGTPLFGAADWDWQRLVEDHSLGWVTARSGALLVGFLNVPWDGLVHAWLQDVVVAPSHQRLGIGRDLVAAAARGAREAGCEWLHVDFEERLRPFYLDACGFVPTAAGLLRL